MTASIGHVMILASAGSGKTYALTNRFVALLAHGAPPERIVALTFTRKAAGEFFDEILNKLAQASRDSEYARRLARDIDRPELGTNDFLAMLRGVADAMHRLRLGTIDSFFARIARVFPLELGLAGEFEILEEHAARFERQRVLRRMFARAGELGAAQKEFIEAFKRATFGAEEKRLGPRLDAFLDAHHESFLSAPEGAAWGDPARIWPNGSVWLEAKVDRVAAVRTLRGWLEIAGVADKQRERWEAFLAAVDQWAPGVPPPRELEYVVEKALEAWSELRAGPAVLEFDRKRQELDAAASAALADLTQHVIGSELLRRLATTRGIHAVLRGYEGFYHDAVRRAGKLTFADVQRLLQPEVSGRVLTRRGETDEEQEAAATERMFIDFRLDAEIDHWLLDEFQDTSFGQWSVLRNLIDEAVQDPEGRRTFFCVGDVKQAIFTWREGDPRLFREIYDHYNAASPGAIAERHLVESWRSGPALIEMVNAVFGDQAVLGELFPGPAAQTWNREWRAHTSAVPQRQGQAALLHAEDEEERWRRTVELLHEIRPLEKGLTCAVLVQTNKVAAELADYLRREAGVPVVADSDLHVCTDNPLGAALLSLVHVAAHPGDTMAWEHVQMTPLGEVLREEKIATPEALTERVLSRVHAEGFERTLASWAQKLDSRLAPDDAFGRERARQFAAAAGRFDETGSRDVAEFVAFMRRHAVRDPESAAVIRVMTIHKSKGLGFDVVLLPDLEGKRIDERRTGLAVQKLPDRSVEWILDLPPKLFWQGDDVLARHVRAAEAEACYEALSLLYVAMTRAKRAMYVVTKPVGKSVSRNYPKILAETLGEQSQTVQVGALSVVGAWMSGDPEWHLKLSPVAPSLPRREDVPVLAHAATARVVRRSSQRPSGERAGYMNAAQVFALESAGGADFGTAVHALFAEVEWTEAAELEARIAAWRGRDVRLDAQDEVRACLESEALRPVWTRRPGEKAEVWRERAFEVVLGPTWVTGVFDRVVVERDSAGAATRATVYDFKTDRVTSDAGVAAAVRRHASQLNLYRKVAAILTRLPVQAVGAELILTHRRQRVAVPATETVIPG